MRIGMDESTVAIKTFEFTLDSYIIREAATLGKANHRNIVKFFGLEEINGLKEMVLIMEH